MDPLRLGGATQRAVTPCILASAPPRQRSASARSIGVLCGFARHRLVVRGVNATPVAHRNPLLGTLVSMRYESQREPEGMTANRLQKSWREGEAETSPDQ